jgi:hypothetical protein
MTFFCVLCLRVKGALFAFKGDESEKQLMDLLFFLFFAVRKEDAHNIIQRRWMDDG